MARLDAKPYPGDWSFDGGIDEAFVRHQRQYDEIVEKAKQSDGVVGQVLHFPMGDGSAMYVVKSEKPLVLQHVPYMDAWQAWGVTIRGLRLADVRAMVESERKFRKLFGKSKEAKRTS